MIIRQKIEITKRNLTPRLPTPEQQVTNKVQSPGTADNAVTETVTDAVHSAARVFVTEMQFRPQCQTKPVESLWPGFPELFRNWPLERSRR